MSHKIALLSNINMNYVIRLLKSEDEIFTGEGYGNELGQMLDPDSAYSLFNPEITFLIIDLLEALDHDLSPSGDKIIKWFSLFENAMSKQKRYYISDAYLWGPEVDVIHDVSVKGCLEQRWMEELKSLQSRHENIRIFSYHRLMEKLGGEQAFSRKLWYLGRILHTNEAQKGIAEAILTIVKRPERILKKVLILDLDNTLWGGLAGEAEHTPVVLSGEHTGLAYKDLQRVIGLMQEDGVILAVVSKNNEADALEILNSHPHMILRPERFAAMKINWEDKHKNILDIAAELNLGTDSFVFWDDNPAERQLVKQMLPEVTVPDFPDKPEALAGAMVLIYQNYFEKDQITREDREKTGQYAANVKRNRLKESTGNFENYLKQLEIIIYREEPEKNIARLIQLINKTNQFNLTTIRYDGAGLQAVLKNPQKRVFLYRAADCFGDNGIVAAFIIDTEDKIPVIEEFVMSCRVMGKNIEYALVEDVENHLLQEGYETVRGKYLPTAKNKPVEFLYDKLGYSLAVREHTGEKVYELSFEDRPKRNYYAKIR